jgi:hypothetical protein
LVRVCSFPQGTSNGTDTSNPYLAKAALWNPFPPAEDGSQALGAFSYKHAFAGLASSFILADGHPRASTATVLKGTASHASTRKCSAGNNNETHFSSHDWLGLGEDDESHSDRSSFTPSDYKPDFHADTENEGHKENNYEAPDNTTTPAYLSTRSKDGIALSSKNNNEAVSNNRDNAMGEARDDSHNNNSDGTSSSEERISNDSFTPSVYRAGSPPLPPLQPTGSTTTGSTAAMTDVATRFTDTDDGKVPTPHHHNHAKPAGSFAPPPALTGLEHSLLPHALRDGLSPLLALPNPFNPTATDIHSNAATAATAPAASVGAECDWPSYAEYTSEGDGRVKRWETGDIPGHAQSQTYGDAYATDDGLNGGYGDEYGHGGYAAWPDFIPPFTSTTSTHYSPPPLSLFSLSHDTDGCTNAMTEVPAASGGERGRSNPRRFLPVPRFRTTVDPRLGLTQQEVQRLIAEAGGGGSGENVPWEMRLMAGERWDFHRERRLQECWGFESFEDGEAEEVGGWDALEGDADGALLPGMRMAWELVGRVDDPGMEAMVDGLVEGKEEEAGERVEDVMEELLGEVHGVLRAFGGAY